jgi:hypothetical protein
MEKASIIKWMNYSKRISGDVDAMEKNIFSGKDDDIFKEWLEINREAYESKKFIIKKIIQLRRFYADMAMLISSPDIYANPANFQQSLETFESKLSSFKQSMRSEFDLLEVSEHALFNEISGLDHNFDSIAETASNQSHALEQKRITTERQNKDIEKTGIIGALDRKVSQCSIFCVI